MSEWEEEKRRTQTAFITPDDNIEAVHESVDNFYRHILTRGYIEPGMGNIDLNQQILEGDFREPSIKGEDLNHFYDQELDVDHER
ncbi:hypothetical protein KSB_26440 [Ktedonobacter robiniae]|uniref:Uncharacterized protein n=1 Tax=Ktedonobacter robiniae TaxID=2778365 RepID=A0ABQ3UN39_9CHLR|nr:hypothetical protein KSB_26440 [Ktedonobacter robiniae]